MVKTLRLVGGAGTGKTHELLRLMVLNIEQGYCDPYSLGFVSFTRAARAEAVSRAASTFDVPPADLERWGWFKTLHAVCYRQLMVGKDLLTENKESCEWISKALGEEYGSSGESVTKALAVSRDVPRVQYALGCWSIARNSMESLRSVCERLQTWNTPAPEIVVDIVSRYEQHKRLDGRCDFTDLLSRFAGVRFDPTGASRAVMPEGEIPDIPVWMLDESQDQSALSDAVARRLVENAHHAYIVGDPFQSVFSFSGSHHRHFMSWPGEQRILNQSYRCPSQILGLGERVLQGCSDYWDRGIMPREDGGEISLRLWSQPWEYEIDPAASWLLIARTNYQAARIAKRLDQLGVPWQPTDGDNGGWGAPTRNKATLGMVRLQDHQPIAATIWREILKQIPAKLEGEELLERGTKTHWPNEDRNWEETRDLARLPDWGATPVLQQRIFDGRWMSLIRNAERFVNAYRRHGEDVVMSPPVRVGTVHSVKGAEADNVAVMLTTSSLVDRGCDPDEERRIGYVAATRARHRLWLIDEHAQHEMKCLREVI